MRWSTIPPSALLAVLGVSVAAPFSVAYARPPSRYLPRHPSNRCNTICNLRCGGSIDVASNSRSSASLSMAQSSGGIDQKHSAKYHLIWSPNFWKKMAASALLLIAAQLAWKKNATGFGGSLLSNDMQTCHHGLGGVFPTAVLLPLLSSSCCAIQLIINALSGWGCAGFNTYLGPIRPILLPVLLLSTWNLRTGRSMAWSIASLLLAFLPEILDVTNNVRSRRWNQKSAGVSPATQLLTATAPIQATLRLNIPTMGCVACVNKVNTSIRQCKAAANISDETSWLTDDGAAKGGMAELSISGRTSDELEGIVEDVMTAVKNAGFECDMESLRRA